MNISKEDYIKAIYELGGYMDIINNKAIADRLKVSAPSVSEMVRKLVRDDLVTYKEYRGVKLTEYGVIEARKVRKRHLLWEVFLVEKLGYGWEEVDDEAEKLEHVTSDRLEARLDSYLGFPKTCPHGTPMVLDCGDLIDRDLGQLKVGEGSRIIRVVDSPEVLGFLDGQGLNIGSKIRVKYRVDFGIIVEREDGTSLEIGEGYYGKIFVE